MMIKQSMETIQKHLKQLSLKEAEIAGKFLKLRKGYCRTLPLPRKNPEPRREKLRKNLKKNVVVDFVMKIIFCG
jgi:hypothetical protein